MTSTLPARQALTLDPDGVPVSLVDIAGAPLDGTLWGAVRAGGAVALIVTELDRSDFYVPGPGDPPTAGQMRALADALDNDPNDPHLMPGSRAWEKERADRLAADVETMQQSVRDYAAETELAHDSERQAWELTAQLQARAETAERKLLTLKHGDGALTLAKAAVRVDERQQAARRVRQARAEGDRQALRAAVAAAVTGAVAGLLIGRSR